MYIGSTVNFKKRKSEHFGLLKRGVHHSSALQNAWNKYGNLLIFQILLICDKTDLLFYEQLLLDNFKPEYNICPNTGNSLGIKLTEETKKKISESNKKRRHSEESKQKIRAAHLGRKKSPEHILNMANAKRGVKTKPASAERKIKIGLANKGRKFTEEQKENLRRAWKKRKLCQV